MARPGAARRSCSRSRSPATSCRGIRRATGRRRWPPASSARSPLVGESAAAACAGRRRVRQPHAHPLLRAAQLLLPAYAALHSWCTWRSFAVTKQHGVTPLRASRSERQPFWPEQAPRDVAADGGGGRLLVAWVAAHARRAARGAGRSASRVRRAPRSGTSCRCSQLLKYFPGPARDRRRARGAAAHRRGAGGAAAVSAPGGDSGTFCGAGARSSSGQACDGRGCVCHAGGARCARMRSA